MATDPPAPASFTAEYRSRWPVRVYELDSKGKKGSHYVYAVVSASQFTSVPAEGGMVTITGPLKWPYEIAAIDP